jgi:hypothetical protein
MTLPAADGADNDNTAQVEIQATVAAPPTSD